LHACKAGGGEVGGAYLQQYQGVWLPVAKRVAAPRLSLKTKPARITVETEADG